MSKQTFLDLTVQDQQESKYKNNKRKLINVYKKNSIRLQAQVWEKLIVSCKAASSDCLIKELPKLQDKLLNIQCLAFLKSCQR